MSKHFRIALILFTAVALIPLSGCAAKRPVPSGVVTLAVLDGTMAEGLRETRKSTVGWWFGAKTRYDSGNAGIALGDVVAHEFAEVPGVQVVSREDFRSYYSEKERLLSREFPDMTPEERLFILEGQSPLDYGRSINVDFILAGRVEKARLARSHFLRTWTGSAEYTLQLWDVRSGRNVWEWSEEDTDLFASPVSIMGQLARRARRDAIRADAFSLYP